MLLDENWALIRKKVIIPLWNKKFKSMYESIKLDYDDFESLAGFELFKAMKSFDPEKSNIFTFASRVITQKAKTELRDCTQRDRRKVLHISQSFKCLSEQIDMPIPETPSDSLSEKMMAYLKRLSTLQKQVLFLMAEGYSNDDIKARLHITTDDLANACAALRSYRNVSLLY